MRVALAPYAFLSIGANLPGNAGAPRQTLARAIDVLRALSHEALLVSAYFESDPKDCPPGSPRYCNAVVGLIPQDTDTAESLLLKLQQLEASFGRHRTGLLNESRTLDLDILTFPATTSNTSALVLPHPRAHERRFVLEPWIQLAGADWVLQGKTLGTWLDQCTDPPLLELE